MDQKTFLEKTGALFDADAHFQGHTDIASRTFLVAERTAFLQHLWEQFQKETIDFDSPECILALQEVQRRFRSVQEQAQHFPEVVTRVRQQMKAVVQSLHPVP